MAKETKKYGIETKRDTGTPVLPVSSGCHVSLNYTWMLLVMTRHSYDVELDDTWLSCFTEILGDFGLEGPEPP